MGAHVPLGRWAVDMSGPCIADDDLMPTSHHLHHVDELARGEDTLFPCEVTRDVGLNYLAE